MSRIRNTKLGRAVLPVAILSILGLAACSGGGGGGTTNAGGEFSGELKVQAYGDWPFVQRNAEEFMKLHPEAKITVGGITNEQMRASGGRLFTSSEAPDVVSYTLQTALMEDWIAAGAIQPLDDVWEKNDIDSSVSETTTELATASDGKKYAVPVALTLLPYTFYNTDKWAEIGATPPNTDTHVFDSLEEFNSSLEKAKGAGMTALSTPGVPFGEYMFGSLFQSSCGTEKYTEISLNWQAGKENSPKYTEECFVKAVQQVTDWAKAGYFPQGMESLTFEQSQTLFDTQKSPTWIMGSWVPPVYEPKGFKWDWSLMPSLGEEPTAHGVSLDSFMVPAAAKNPELAKSFIAFMTSKEQIENKMGKVPARTDVDLSKVIESPILTSIVDKLQSAPQAPGWFTLIPVDVEQEFAKTVISGAMTGAVTPQQAAETLQKASDTYRQQHGK